MRSRLLVTRQKNITAAAMLTELTMLRTKLGRLWLNHSPMKGMTGRNM